MAGTVSLGGPTSAGGFTEMGGNVYFFGEPTPGSRGLWKTDGTPQGTTLVAPVWSQILTAVGDTLYFIGDGNNAGKELWKTDGTTAGTMIVKDLNPGPAGTMSATVDARPMAAAADRLVFMARGTDGRHHPYVSDGTPQGTVSLNNDVFVSGEMTSYNGAVYFAAADAAGHQQLWKTDGTPAGTATCCGNRSRAGRTRRSPSAA